MLNIFDKKLVIRFLPYFLFLFLTQSGFAQSYELAGTVTDLTGEPIAGASIIIAEKNRGTVTTKNGNYSIQLAEGMYVVKVTFLGYKSLEKRIALNSDTTANFTLTPQTEDLEEVIVTDNIEGINIRDTEMSVGKLDASSIKKIPVIFGEVDVIRSLLQLPGISNAGEGASGFNVRGGATDQNLILIDDALVYNSSHLFGFFSIFNADAVDYLKLYKGGIPANYGGRVSSVLDIQQKTGNTQRLKGEGGIGVISSKLTLEGPIQKDKSSFLLSGRGTYAHLFLKLTDNANSAYFYDLNTKLNFNIDEKNTLSFSGYYGLDYVNINDSFTNIYGNAFGILDWEHQFDENISSRLNFSYSQYDYELDLALVGFNFQNSISNLDLSYQIDQVVHPELSLSYGLSSIRYQVNPGKIVPTVVESFINPRTLDDKYAFDNAAFISVSQSLSERINIQYGLRLSAFLRMQDESVAIYANNNPLLYDEIRDIYVEAEPLETVEGNPSEVEKSFINLEPRLGLSYLLNDKTSVKASYNRMVQNLHLISNTSSPTPFDVWTPSGTYIKPQKLDQYALGFFKDFENIPFTLETEVFYKHIDDRIDYIDGADLIANDAIERVILNGESRAYGLEFYLKKKKGKLTGWLSYTLSRSEQRTPGRTPDEIGINNGEWYLNGYDKTHDISLTSSYELSDKWQLNSNFVLQTGRPVNFPVGQFEFQDLNIPVFEGRNLNRLPAFHRLDLSATYTPDQKRKNWSSSWNFGIYNVYNRRNAASLNFEQNASTGQNEAVRFSIFGIVPSVSYSFKF
ncbi:TonB-dependent receptor [Psychroflexus sp. YR1-1]|uniref:TonB-dependent receptor n=1 Tax=Psychroflexus aurantiacus TaxID=2709310 RepID=A0A6B3R7U5_9FLAO|nr:TonB-dependent receptor [Psychroflexus aurantiacus]NEV93614.1 TonB-dependent receptor [Psychroflexus aurantiacus]